MSSGGVAVGTLAAQQETLFRKKDVSKIGKSKLFLSVSVNSCLSFDVAVPHHLLAADDCRRKSVWKMDGCMDRWMHWLQIWWF